MKNLIFKGDLLTADFEEKTMTFVIENDMVVQAGNYTIVRTEDYEKLVKGADKSTVKAWEDILEPIKKLVGTDKVTIYFKENKEEAEVHINDKYWGTYDTK